MCDSKQKVSYSWRSSVHGVPTKQRKYHFLRLEIRKLFCVVIMKKDQEMMFRYHAMFFFFFLSDQNNLRAHFVSRINQDQVFIPRLIKKVTL